MNKEQQSLDELRALVHSELDGTKMLDEYLKHCDTLQKIVDKATPKKPITEEFEDDRYNNYKHYCPTCTYSWVCDVPKYCPECGQALDWRIKNDY